MTSIIRIQRIETRIVDHAIRKSRIVVSPVGVHDRSRFVTVIVHAEDGLRGFGEAATTPQWSGETAETAQWVIEHLFAPKLNGASFGHPREAFSIMESASFGNPFAKGALDTAIWDLWARQQRVPAGKLFGDREPVGWIPTRASVGCYDVKETLRIATEFWNEGIRTLKFKIGVTGLDDVARLRTVREKLGDEPIFTVDANGAYRTAKEAVAAIEKLLPHRPVLVEQPTHRDRIGQLAEVRRQVNVPIMADECVFTPEHLNEALDCDAFDVLSVYPGKNGGVTNCIEMVKTAQRAGKQCAIGSNLETDLGQAAMAALAASLSAFPVEEIPCDFQAALFYDRSSIHAPMKLKNGRIAVPNGVGFGAEPAE
jgi:L-alanine-DL-glutamate epimerase-like enolase superfamily enzyme